MSPVVFNELAIGYKSFLTNVTFVASIAAVTFLVKPQCVFSGKFLSTFFALVRSSTIMDRLYVMLKVIGL